MMCYMMEPFQSTTMTTIRTWSRIPQSLRPMMLILEPLTPPMACLASTTPHTAMVRWLAARH